jgi:CheY-like chemotaxis protein
VALEADDWLLLVDDDEGIQDALAEFLRAEGYWVEVAANGAEALRRLRDASRLPTAILLDLMMPVMDGFQFRAAQLSDARWAQIPVLVLTAGLIDEQVHRLGVAGYHRKPIDIDRLLEDLEDLLLAQSR